MQIIHQLVSPIQTDSILLASWSKLISDYDAMQLDAAIDDDAVLMIRALVMLNSSHVYDLNHNYVWCHISHHCRFSYCECNCLDPNCFQQLREQLSAWIIKQIWNLQNYLIDGNLCILLFYFNSNTIRYQLVSKCIRIGIELVSNYIWIGIELCSNWYRIVFEDQTWKLNPGELHSGLYVHSMTLNTNPTLSL